MPPTSICWSIVHINFGITITIVCTASTTAVQVLPTLPAHLPNFSHFPFCFIANMNFQLFKHYASLRNRLFQLLARLCAQLNINLNPFRQKFCCRLRSSSAEFEKKMKIHARGAYTFEIVSIHSVLLILLLLNFSSESKTGHGCAQRTQFGFYTISVSFRDLIFAYRPHTQTLTHTHVILIRRWSRLEEWKVIISRIHGLHRSCVPLFSVFRCSDSSWIAEANTGKQRWNLTFAVCSTDLYNTSIGRQPSSESDFEWESNAHKNSYQINYSGSG